MCQLAEFTLASRESHFFSADHSKDRDAWVEAFTRVAVSVFLCRSHYDDTVAKFTLELRPFMDCLLFHSRNIHEKQSLLLNLSLSLLTNLSTVISIFCMNRGSSCCRVQW